MGVGAFQTDVWVGVFHTVCVSVSHYVCRWVGVGVCHSDGGGCMPMYVCFTLCVCVCMGGGGGSQHVCVGVRLDLHMQEGAYQERAIKQ